MFKKPREHRPELASSSLVSKDALLKAELGFECKLRVPRSRSCRSRRLIITMFGCCYL